MRDDFTKETQRIIAARAGYRCSNPTCGRLTAKAHPENPSQAMSVGVAAHIEAASPGGPRYNHTQVPEERKAPENGIWLCQSCSRQIDVAQTAFSVETLRTWRSYAEQWAAREASASADMMTGLIKKIDTAHQLISAFIEQWQVGEPPIDFTDFQASSQRMINYGQSRVAAFHGEVMPVIMDIVSSAQTILGPLPLMLEAEGEVITGPTNYISMRMLDEYLQKVKANLTLR